MGLRKKKSTCLCRRGVGEKGESFRGKGVRHNSKKNKKEANWVAAKREEVTEKAKASKEASSEERVERGGVCFP